MIRAETSAKAHRLEAESLARAHETDRVVWMANHDAILREMALVRERMTMVRDEHRANAEELEHAQRRADAVSPLAHLGY